MKVFARTVRPGFKLMTSVDDISRFPKMIEMCGRTCYKSEDKISAYSADKFVRMLISKGHESVLEHCSITVRIICDRATSHQLVRHRIASYSQESQRYCNYGKSDALNVIIPDDLSFNFHGYNIYPDNVGFFFDDDTGYIRILFVNEAGENSTFLFKPDDQNDPLWTWLSCCLTCYRAYKVLLSNGLRPEDARSVLPNATKTEVVTTYNLREWRHFFSKRCDKHAQRPIRRIAKSLLNVFHEIIPCVFHDLADIYLNGEKNE